MLSELFNDLRYRLRAIFRRDAVERELDQELRFHLEAEAAKLAGAGLPAHEAMRRARTTFGGVERIKEESRDARGVATLDAAGQDLRYAWRTLRRNPGFTAAVVVTLGLGIGANAAMFGIVDRLLLRPPPMLRDADNVHRVYLTTTGRDGVAFSERYTEYTRFLDLARWTTSFSQVAGFTHNRLAVGVGEDAAELMVGVVSASFFGFFDAHPALGRFFDAKEDVTPKGADVVVLSYSFWQTRYGGRKDAIGQTIQVGPVVCTIIGVTPKGFVSTGDEAPPALYMPITTYAGTVALAWTSDITDYYTQYHWGWMQLLVRRKPGVTVSAASADLTNAYLRSWDAERALSPETTPAAIARPHAIVASVLVERGPNQSTVSKVAAWISGVAAIVLLIACANVANLMLARSVQRRREIALRLALGVRRSRLFGQLLVESLVLAVLGGAAGLLVARWGGAVLRATFLPDGSTSDTVVDGRTLAFAAAIALVAGLLTGLAPIFQARQADLTGTLKAGVREGSFHRSRLRSALLLLQATLSVVLLVGAGLFVRSLQNVRAIRLGYDVDPLLYVFPNMRGVKVPDAQQAELARRLQEAARGVPGVENVTRALTVPMWMSRSTGLYVAGIDSVRRLGRFTLQAGSPEYFATVGTRILRGRGITTEDRANAPRVAVVSESMAKLLWPGKDAIGQCMRVEADTMPCTTIVGIAENIRSRDIVDDPGTHYYMSVDQFHPGDAALFVRVKGQGSAFAEAVRRQLQRVMPGTSYVTVTPMHDIIDPKVRSWHLGATMFLAFGALALVLAAIGLYSVIAYDVAQRTHELGVRIALGARAGHLLRLVVGDGVRFAVIGITMGSAISFATGRWMAPLLFAESPKDPVVFGVVTAVLLCVALIASALPAARAARVDPNAALRSE
jgi:predicted permease